MAVLMSASTTISLRGREMATTAPDRNLPALALTCANVGIASGATSMIASPAAFGRFASIARRAFFQASSFDIAREAIRRSAAVRQPSSASRWRNQLSRTSSTWALVATPVLSTSTSVA